MKLFQSSLFRALCAIIVGVLILKYPQEGVTWLTQAIGALFLLSGIISLIAYWHAAKHAGEYTVTDREGRVISGSQPSFPIVGTGSIILGLVLIMTPASFIDGLMYILGAIMILGGIQQLMNLVIAHRLGRISLLFWVAPSLILLTGIFVIVKPMETAALSLQILGWCSLVYGVTEIINSLLIWRIRKVAAKLAAAAGVQKDVEPIAEEISSELNDVQPKEAEIEVSEE